MAEASLNFNEDSLDKSSGLYNLYNRFYNGMSSANEVDIPNFTTNPPTTEAGEIDSEAIKIALTEYATIQMKNSAYMMANAIMSIMSGSGDGGGSTGGNSGYVSRSGGSMSGLFSSLYGFKAGSAGASVLNIPVDINNDTPLVEIDGQLKVSLQIQAKGGVNVGVDGILFNNIKTIYVDDEALNVESDNIAIGGAVKFAKSWSIGDTTATLDGLWYGEMAYYHGANSNTEDVDWSMRDGHVYGDLTVDGTASITNKLTATGGFVLGDGETAKLYSSDMNDNIVLNSDLSIIQGYGVKFDDTYVLSVRDNKTISLSAPGRVLNLGDSDGDATITKYIALQTGIYQHNGEYCIVSQYGDGNFKNSLSAGCGNANSNVLETYYKAPEDCGVVFSERIRFGNAVGPSFSADDTALQLRMTIPYAHIENEVNVVEQIPLTFQHKYTTSLFKDQSLSWSASLHIDTEAEFVVFQKPVEARSVSIISEKYKTRLIENTLFFDDSVFFEGVTDGIRHAGNAYFDGSLSSQRFASGFAGYGWAIKEGDLYGGIAATFDELTVRKKMRIYELEVQKASVTNGSLWVSDACSGDSVEEII